MSDVTERMTKIFREILGDETLVLRPEMTADDVPGWDSVSHITLIYTVEDEFGIKFSSRDLENMKCVGDLVETVEKRS